MDAHAFDPQAFEADAFEVGPGGTNSSGIDNAICATLGRDSALLTLMPNGVYFASAPPEARRYVLVTHDGNPVDLAVFGRRAQEEIRYRIVAVGLSTMSPNMDQAAYRIDQLLEDQPVTVAGYTWATVHRLNRIRETTVDPINPSARWHTRGGIYYALFATGSAP